MRLLTFSKARHAHALSNVSKRRPHTSPTLESCMTAGPAPDPYTNVSTDVPATSSTGAHASCKLIGGSYEYMYV